jgi:hypothetical protein
MAPEVITALIGLIGMIIGAIPTYIFMQKLAIWILYIR